MQFGFSEERYKKHDWRVIRLAGSSGADSSDRCAAKITPDMGGNLFSLIIDRVEYLVDSGPVVDGERFLGTFLLYPSPGLMRDARFTFDGRTFAFAPNRGPHFIHGLARKAQWTWDTPVTSGQDVALTSRLRFAPGTPLYTQFPIHHDLTVTYTLRADGFRFDFRVNNLDREHRLPFGLSVHPFFRIIGGRSDIRLQVPATEVFELVEGMPTGRVESLDGHPADLRKPMSLNQLNLDDIYMGMTPEGQQIIYYDSIGARVILRSSELFTHSVVYTPMNQQYFCVENQSCSSDTHNLYARGFHKESGLKILNPGESITAWVEYTIQPQ